jgi:sugar/nucleoside kinase (ribokinase family)
LDEQRTEISSQDGCSKRSHPQCRFDITIAGELNLDFILYGLPDILPEEQEVLASDFTMTLGSSSAILAHNLAVLGSRVGFASRVGPDPLGLVCCQRLEEAGVDTTGIVHAASGKATGATFLLPFRNTGTRRILTYAGAMEEMGLEDLDEAYLAAAGHFHLSSLFLHRRLVPHIPELYARMKAKGLTTSLDTNDDPADEWGEVLHQTLRHVDVLLCNEREVRKMAGLTDADAAIRKMTESVPLLVVKRGSQGALAYCGQQQFQAAALAVSVVDTVGAGDSFNAGFLHQWLRGAGLPACLAFGNVTGALSTTRPGGTEAFREAAHREQFLRAHWRL